MIGEKQASPTAEGRRERRSRAALAWLVVGCYLLGALLVTARLWIDPASRVQTGDPGDVALFAWYVEFAARAVGHGHLPALMTTMMNAPQGVSLMWNTSFLLPGVVLAPVTLLAGVQTSLTVALTLGFAGSAASLFWVLRRWEASLGAAALAGAVYGFSPALVASGAGHYHLQFAVLPPLIIHAVARLVTGRGRGLRTGAWLGVLCAAQIFIGEELLVYTAFASVVVVVVLAASRPRTAPRRALGALPGLAVAVAVFLLLDGYALWTQFLGPLAEHSTLQRSRGGHLQWFVTPPSFLLFHTQASAAAANAISPGTAELVDYLGWPLLGVAVIAGVVFWRDLRVRIAAVTWAVLELCALGGGGLSIGGVHVPGRALPWHWLQGLPGLAQVLPWRFAILADAAVAMLLAFALDRALAAFPRAEGHARPIWPRYGLGAVAVLAVLPLVPLPYTVTAVPPVPAGWQATFTGLRLPAKAPVLVLPFPSGRAHDPMRWQTDTGRPTAMVGGYFLGPSRTGQAVFFYHGHSGPTVVGRYLTALQQGKNPGRGPSDARIRSVVESLRPAAIVAVTGPKTPLARLLTRLFGRPSLRAGQVLSWRLRH